MQATSVDLAVEKALVELGADKDHVEVEVLHKGGLFSKAKVRVTVKETEQDRMEKFVNSVLEHMGLISRAACEIRDGALYVNITGEDSSHIIGHRGEVLDALQYLSMTYLNEQKGDIKKVVIDAEDYRSKRKQTLTALAEKVAEKAVRMRRKLALEPMNPFERRIIHSALANSEVVTTQSEGEEPMRHIVVIPVGVELKDPRPLKYEERRGDGKGGKGDKGRRSDRKDRKGKGDRRERKEEPEVADGNVYRGYYTDSFSKPTAQSGPPKYKSFGGKKGLK